MLSRKFVGGIRIGVRHLSALADQNERMPPLQLERYPGTLFHNLLEAIQRKSKGATWRAYKAMVDTDQLSSLPPAYHTMVLQRFRLNNKIIAYGPDYVQMNRKRILTIFHNMKSNNIQPDVRDYNHLLDFFGHAHDWHSCQRYWKELLESEVASPNTYSYNNYMRAAIQCRKPAKALFAFTAMKEKDIKPNIVTYNILIDAHGRLGNLGMAMAVFESNVAYKHPSKPIPRQYEPNDFTPTSFNAQAARDSIPLKVKGDDLLEPDADTFRALIGAYGRQGDLFNMTSVHQELMPASHVEPTLEVYNELMRWYCAKRDEQSALQVLAHMDAMGVKPNEATFNGLFRLRASQMRRPKLAESLMDVMKTKYNLKPLESMYRLLIKMHTKAKRFDESDRLTKELHSQQSQSQSQAKAFVNNKLAKDLASQPHPPLENVS